MADTEHALAAIADDVGFGDRGGLSRHLKQVVGLSPAAYRKWIRVKEQAMAQRGRLTDTGTRGGS